MNTDITLTGKFVILMMGSPAAGKSTTAKKYYGHLKMLDADAIKETLPGYDPDQAWKVHDESARILEKQFQEAILKDENFILDGTGSNSDRMIRRVTEARSNGFKVALVYVTCPLKTCLERNKNRERKVPEFVVIEKYKDVHYSFDIVSPHVDQVIVIDNS